MKSQPCHAHSPQGWAAPRLTGKRPRQWGTCGVRSCWHRPRPEPRGRAGCCSPFLEQGSRGCCWCCRQVKGCLLPAWLLGTWILHPLEKTCRDAILSLTSSWEPPLLLPHMRSKFCSTEGLRALSSLLELSALQTEQGMVIPPAFQGAGAEHGQGTLFHPLDFCGWCSCGGCRINSPLGEGQGWHHWGQSLQKDI